MTRPNSLERDHRRPGVAQFALFGAGDFACNLYWQSVSLYLLFFYTDVLGLSAALAGTLYMAGALWDGIADLLVGIAAQRPGVRYRRFIAIGALPLGAAFVLLYATPSLTGTALAVAIGATQILFRTLYAVVNVPYAAWSARFSPDSRDRTTLAGVRMLFGTAAALLVTIGTPWIALHATGSTTLQPGYAAAAIVYGVVGTGLLLALVAGVRETRPAHSVRADAPILTCLHVLLRNRAFVTLNLAAMVAGLAAAVLTQSVLYFFKHVAAQPAQGPQALAAMAVAGTIAVPLWMLVTRQIGLRAAWFVAVVWGLGCLALFGFIGGGIAAIAILALLQAAFTGFNLIFWSMLPNTVEYGEAKGGARVEALAFGVAALLQKIGLAAAAGLLGLFYRHIGYVAGAAQSSTTIAGIRDLMVYAGSAGLVASALVMLGNPLKRGVHAALVEQLATRADA
ncbi:glycoside-pentoside-hexuronide (GPH):cation symporter [Sphingomonas sp. RB3P16]|uniref:MFS transporter n=1 Tax=Parasphingomonas frigoris TaxID=3096163 RepID=UPI002FCB56A1